MGFNIFLAGTTSRFPQHTVGTILTIEVDHGAAILLLAGMVEIGWAIGLKFTDGFTRVAPTLATVAAMALSLALLGGA